MDFLTEFMERIRKQIGLELPVGEDFSFFQPAGNEHLVQFCYKNFPEEYWELDYWDRHHLFLCDLAAELDVEFNLDDDGNFASLDLSDGKNRKPVQAIMDLRDEYLIVMYYYGDSKANAKTNQHLLGLKQLHPCYPGMSMLQQMIEMFEEVRKVEYDFEQSTSLFLDPVVFKGVLSGNMAGSVIESFLQHHRQYFNINAVLGRLTDETQGDMVLHSSGMLQAGGCRLSSFLELVEKMQGLFREKYSCLVEKYVLKWEDQYAQSSMLLNGNLMEFWLADPIDKLEGLMKYLTRGDKVNPLFGTIERVSRKLWSVKSIDVRTGQQVELEVSDSMLRVFLKNRNSIPLVDFIEKYLRRHVEASLENPAY